MDKPALINCDTLPGIAEYKCPESCGCNILVKWTFDNGTLQRYHTYCKGNGNKVHFVPYVKNPPETPTDDQYRVMKNLFMRLLLGIVYTDQEARPKDEIIIYIDKITEDVGAPFHADRIFTKMVEDNLLIFVQEIQGMGYYAHNLPKTLSLDYGQVLKSRQGTT